MAALVGSAACGGRASISADAAGAGGRASFPDGSAGGGAVAGVFGSAGTGARGSAPVAGAGTTDSGGTASVGGASIGGATSTGGMSSAGAGGALPQPSCAELPATCGPRGDASCCSATVVPGGSYDRAQNGGHFPASVSDFTLDTYEITVGRFRKFVAAYAQDMIPAGAGKNPHNAADPGWDPAWNASLDSDSAALRTALKCDQTYTWTDTPGSASTESLPIDCVSWFEAEAFCVWDGGRLPTDVEWTYVAFAGAEQRLYPWGTTTPDCTYANFLGAAGGSDYCVQPGIGSPNRVGSESPKGDSKWGQADMGGNVAEWLMDWTRLYSSPCVDCAALTPGANTRRLIKGGSFGDGGLTMSSAFRVSAPPQVSVDLFGARCARSVPGAQND